MKTLFTIFGLAIVMAALAQDVTLAGPGNCGITPVTGSWQVPCNVTAITVHLYGAGGGGGGGGGGSNGGAFNTRGGGGGGGGAYSSSLINVVPGSSFTYSIGGGGCGGGNGSDGSRGDNGNSGISTSFSGTDSASAPVNLVAGGGAGGQGGSGSGNSPGSGGSGGTAVGGTTNDAGGSGNGGSGGNGGAGGNGAGPAGGTGGQSTNNPGNAIGGGGAGGGDSDGGNGAAGSILIYFTTASSIPDTPIVASTAASCSAAGSSTLTNYDNTLTYTFNPTGPVADASGFITGMVAGTSYTLVASSGTCTPAESAPFSNQAQIVAPATPTVTGTPATCAADGSSTISNYNAAYAYTFTPAGPTVATGGTITNMATGTNYQVAASDSACTSAPSADFSNQAMLTGQACDTTTTGVYNLTNTTAVINVFPNPAVNQATIQLSGLQQAQDEATLHVTNNMGQLVYSQQLLNYNNPVKLNIATYQQGIYTISIRFGNGWVAKGRLVKE